MNLSKSVTLGLGLGALLLPAEELSPSLQVLPLNSTLSDVTIPRYDENQNRVAYLKSDLMEILADGKPVNGRQAIMVDCTGIQLRMAYEAADGDIEVDMERARYRVNPGVLTVQETITAHSPRFHITGVGGVFHLDSRRGFIFGPVDCKVFPKPEPTAHHPTMLTPIHALIASTGLASMNAGYNPPSAKELLQVDELVAMKSGHNPPSAEELLKVEHFSQSMQPQIQKEQKAIDTTTSAGQTQSKEADQRLLVFAGDVESDSLNLLIQNPPPPKAAVQAKPPLVNPQFTVTCDGGCFFDGTENLLVLLRDVVVKEDRFTLKAQEEIKVFFIPPPEEKEEKKEGEAKEEGGAGLGIGDVKSLVASGGVHFSGIDKNGNPVEATAATAFYNDVDKVLILKDGSPTFWTKKGEREFHFQAVQKDASVRIELANDVMNAQTSPNGWNFGAKLPPKKN